MQNIAGIPENKHSLAAAFAAAEYVVEAEPAPIVIRIGDCAPPLDRLLNGHDWAIVTAHNAGGVRRPANRNDAAHRLLTQALGKLAPRFLVPACNRDPRGRWPDEPGWLFTPESLGQADRLARRFEQQAIVVGRPGQPAELRWYDGGNAPVRGNTSAVDS